MMRWLLRLSVGALIAALLFWLWNRVNQDLVEEDELDEEIPFEFDVPLDDSAAVLPSAASAEGDVADRLATSVGTLTTMPAETATDGTAPEATNGAVASPAAAAADDAPAPSTEESANTDSAADGAEQAEVAPTPRSHGAQEGWDPHAQEEETSDAPPPGAGDNLTTIKGIGQAYSARLAEMGITTYGALISTPVDILAAAFPRVAEAEIENWIAQAREQAGQET